MSRLDQGLMEGYSCPTCRRPLLLSSEGQTRSTTAEVANVQRIAEQLTMGMNQQRVPGNEHPVEQQNPSDAVWRYVSVLGFLYHLILFLHCIHDDTELKV